MSRRQCHSRLGQEKERGRKGRQRLASKHHDELGVDWLELLSFLGGPGVRGLIHRTFPLADATDVLLAA